MAFFNSKKFEVVDVAPQEIVELGIAATLSFYVKDIFKDTVISSVEYLALHKSGRTETVLGTYVTIIDVSGSIYSFAYTPSGVVALDKIKFRLKVTDADGDEHYLETEDYTVVAVS